MKQATSVLAMLALASNLMFAQSPTTTTMVQTFIKVAVPLANTPFTNVTPTVAGLNTMANDLDTFVNSAANDGSLATAQTEILTHQAAFEAKPTTKTASYLQTTMAPHGWLGTVDDATTILTVPYSLTRRKAAIAAIQTNGVKAWLHGQANGIRALATELSLHPDKVHGCLVAASYHIRNVELDCEQIYDYMDYSAAWMGAGLLFGPDNPLALGGAAATIFFGGWYLWRGCPN